MMVLMFLALILSIASLGLDSTYKKLENSMRCVYAGFSPPDPQMIPPGPPQAIPDHSGTNLEEN